MAGGERRRGDDGEGRVWCFNGLQGERGILRVEGRVRDGLSGRRRKGILCGGWGPVDGGEGKTGERNGNCGKQCEGPEVRLVGGGEKMERSPGESLVERSKANGKRKGILRVGRESEDLGVDCEKERKRVREVA
ncbi:hypothetical protein OIU79_022864 [Salix purpurea]|uniref:Uncharacterized protein n=1 Tax=Salix purpurea TaxID=77065 RepID=A0A9Q0WGR8_SALPP|nr:hypothetical protein OIU79_022864 [Salix purpurea]